MWINKNRNIDFFLVLLKTIFLIAGLNIFLTSLINVIILELKKNNLESEINLVSKSSTLNQIFNLI